MYRLITFCILILMASIVQAQETEPLIPVPVSVTDARLNLVADGSYLLWVTGSLGTGCQTPVEVVERVAQTTLEINIFQSIPVSTICPLMLIEYEDNLRFEAPVGVLRVQVGDWVFDLPGAQAVPEAENTRQVETIIESVTLSDDELLVQGYHPDGCQADTQINLLPLSSDWLTIMIYRNVPQGIACTLNIIPFEQVLSLDGLMFDEETPLELALLEVNDLSYFVREGELFPAQRDYPFIEGRNVYNEFAPVRLEVIGTFEDNCDDTVRAYIRERENGGIFDVSIYRVIEADVERDCQPILRTVTTPVSFPADLENALYRYDVNKGALTGAFVAPETSFVAQVEALSNRVPHIIDLVTTALDNDGHLWVNVLGYIPDGCETAVTVDVVKGDGTIDIAVYRLIPPGVMCPQTFIPYSDVFDMGILPAGDYAVTVNNATDVITIP
jgi:hypothetical protein